MHRPVLYAETLSYLNVRPDGRYVDGTLGAAGHATGIAERLGDNGRLLGLDMDGRAVAAGVERMKNFGSKVVLRQANFRGMAAVLRELEWTEVDGLFFDLGISSDRVGSSSRGEIDAEGKDDEGWAQDRRVDITLIPSDLLPSPL